MEGNAMTDLERIEQERLQHMADAIKRQLPAEVPAEAILDAAKAAIEAADRFPEDPAKYPFNVNLDKAPARMPVHARRSIDEIDAAVFNGDTYNSTENHLYLAAHVQRWSKALRLRREDDWINRPEPDPEP